MRRSVTLVIVAAFLLGALVEGSVDEVSEEGEEVPLRVDLALALVDVVEGVDLFVPLDNPGLGVEEERFTVEEAF